MHTAEILSEDMDLGEDDGEECKDPTDIKCILKGVSEVGKSSENENKANKFSQHSKIPSKLT